MIHGGSSHPTLIKKINLNIWLLRDEVEAVIKHRLANCEDKENPPSIQDLIEEYAPKKDPISGDTGEGLQVVEGGKEEDSEENPEENSEEEKPEENSEEENSEKAHAIVNEQSEEDVKDVSTIYQRRPKLEAEKVFQGQAVLSEVNMQTLYFFSSQRFLSGQSVVIEFLVPKRFIVNADVVFCRTFNMRSRIISENRHPYRVAAQFTFLREGERTLLRNFVSSIEPDITPKATPMKATGKIETSEGSDKGGDDLSELDDFDI